MNIGTIKPFIGERKKADILPTFSVVDFFWTCRRAFAYDHGPPQHNFVEQLHPLCSHAGLFGFEADHVATGSGQALDETLGDRVRDGDVTRS
jgi:hypothetical protein